MKVFTSSRNGCPELVRALKESNATRIPGLGITEDIQVGDGLVFVYFQEYKTAAVALTVEDMEALLRIAKSKEELRKIRNEQELIVHIKKSDSALSSLAKELGVPSGL